MTENGILVLLGAFALKHLIVDFILQTPYMYKNKGTLGHPGGLLHAGLHGLFSFAFIIWIGPSFVVVFTLCVAEFVLHYWIDWAKMNLNRTTGWGPSTSEYFWMLLGFDQFCHHMTYIGMVWLLM